MKIPLSARVPKDALEAYLARTLTSAALAEITGFHPVSIRRAIKREPLVPQPKNKRALYEARRIFRASIAHLPAVEIQKLAHVSLSTANRIRKANKKC